MRLGIGAAGCCARFFWPAIRGLKIHILLGFWLAVLAVAGCGREDFSKPPKVHYGRDACAQCRMIIQDERYACAAALAGSRFLKFDDIGCMADFEKGQNEHNFSFWVRDAGADRWLEKKQAHFVHSPDLVTPMGYGFAAFSDAKDVARFIREKAGYQVTWDDLKKEKTK